MTPAAYLDPPMHAWRVRAPAACFDLRSELGLPTDRSIVMTGHQAYFWHAGVLAKFLAADVYAKHHGFEVAWVVPDQDAVDPFALRIPVRRPDGRLADRVVRLDEQPGWREGMAACAVPTSSVLRDAPSSVWPSPLARRVDRMLSALRLHEGESNGAMQVSRAAEDLMSAWIEPGRTCYGTELAGTEAFQAIVERMMQDPDACIVAYNAAVQAHPDARVSQLQRDDVQYRYELPLWWIEADGRRRRVYVEDLESGAFAMASSRSPIGLAPRALLMTGMLRAGACDLFIHGTGGANYDRITEAWFRRWLGVELAPMVVVSADAYVDFGVAAPSKDDVDRAVWKAHSARHNPDLLGDAEAASTKSSLIDAIRRAGWGSDERRRSFRELHQALAAYRQAHSASLQELDAERQSALAGLADQQLICDRTWAFPLLDPDDLAQLRAELMRGLAADVVSPG